MLARYFWAGYGLLTLSTVAWGQPNSGLWAVCSVDPLAELIAPDTQAPPTGEILFDADSGEFGERDATLIGDVVVERGDQRLQAPQLQLDRINNRVSGRDLSFGTPTLAVTSTEGEYDLNDGSGNFEEADYYIAERNAKGHAEHAEVEQEGVKSRFTNATYSTCSRGEELWQVRSKQLDLDTSIGRGKAKHITLAVKSLPVFYWPYLSFPIDDRRHSGFLTPRIGYDEENGYDFSIPYYWNIAPNLDATFTPRYLSNRGFQLGAEFRYLARRHSGEIQLEYLPDDDLFGDDRKAFRIDHRTSLFPKLYTTLLYQYVSDEVYQNDLGNSLNLLSDNYLERRFDVRYYGKNWNVLGRLQGFQELKTTEPYERLPQIQFEGRWPQPDWYGLEFALDAEYVRFENANDNRVIGTRIDILPSLSLPLERSWGFIEPSLSYRYTDYSLDRVRADAEEQPSRNAPIFSVDSGLFFERPLQAPGMGRTVF